MVTGFYFAFTPTGEMEMTREVLGKGGSTGPKLRYRAWAAIGARWSSVASAATGGELTTTGPGALLRPRSCLHHCRADLLSRWGPSARDRWPAAYLARGFRKFLPANLALLPSSSSILNKTKDRKRNQILVRHEASPEGQDQLLLVNAGINLQQWSTQLPLHCPLTPLQRLQDKHQDSLIGNVLGSKDTA